MRQFSSVPQTNAVKQAIEALQTVQIAPHQADHMGAAIQALKKLLYSDSDPPGSFSDLHMEETSGAALAHVSSAPLQDAAVPAEESGDPHALAWGRMLRQRRKAANLSRLELARLAGISESTIKNLETGRRPPTAMVLARLMAVVELGLEPSSAFWQHPSAEPDADKGPTLNCWLAPGFEPLKMLKELVMQVNGRGGHIEQSHMYLDHMSAACWCAIADQEDYAQAYSGIPVDRAAAQILSCAGGAGLDVLSLGCGDGKLDVRLVQHLLGRVEHGDLRLYLLDISQPLLSVAYKHAADTLADRRGVSICAIQGNFHHLPRYTQLLYTPERAHRRRVVTMFGGTFANLENEIFFIRNSLVGFATGDLLLLDMPLTFAPVEQPDEIRRNDPRLKGGNGLGWQRKDEDFLTGPIRRYARDVTSVDLDVELDTTSCPVPGSYSVEVLARVKSATGGEREFSVFRFKRYDALKLIKCLKQLGWDPVDGWRYGDDPRLSYPRLFYLFRRR